MTSASAKITLTYPLYACDFDPQNANRLIVGGGGGAGRSGVGNKITVLETTSPDSLEPSGEIELSRDEDNVTSLAIGQHKGKTTLVYAGINSSVDDQKKGENKHFRVFGIDQPSAKAKAAGLKITEVSRSSLFSNKDPDAYQRVVRLSAPFAGYPQIGAAATGLAKQAQIALFQTSPSGSPPAPKPCGTLDLDKEAADVDVIQTADDQYRVIYCHDYEIHSIKVTAKPGGAAAATVGAPQLVFTTPEDVATGYARPTFRALRLLTPGFLITACNMAKRGGVVLQAYRLPADGAAPARLSASAKLPKHVAQATAMAVTNLHPPAAPGAGAGDTQFVVAVAGVDCSISLYTLDHSSLASIDVLSKLYPLATVRAAHPHPISGLSFSRFLAPGRSPSSGTAATSSPPPKPSSKSAAAASEKSSPSGGPPPPVLKLASISVANTAVVHTIPLRKLPSAPKSSSSAAAAAAAEKSSSKGGPRRPKQAPSARYVVAARSRGPSPRAIIVVSTLGVLLLAALMQSFLEIKSLTHRDYLGARAWAPASWVHHPVGGRRPLGGASSSSSSNSFGDGRTLAQRLAQADGPVVLREREGGSGIEVTAASSSSGAAAEFDDQEEQQQPPPVAWEELPAAQRRAWKEKLKAAGHWGEEMGEAIFKGVLFSELGGVVGGFVRG